MHVPGGRLASRCGLLGRLATTRPPPQPPSHTTPHTALPLPHSVEEGGGSRMLDQTRRECQQEFSRGLRSHEWAQCWLLSPWRQQAAFVLSVATAQLVEAVAEQRDGLLRYVPELYISSLLDMVGVGGGQRWWCVCVCVWSAGLGPVKRRPVRACKPTHLSGRGPLLTWCCLCPLHPALHAHPPKPVPVRRCTPCTAASPRC